MFSTAHAREKLNEAFRAVGVSAIDEIARIKRPSRAAFEACRLLCLFVNTFRDASKRWPMESFTSWTTIQHFIVGSPGSNKLCTELMQLKKTVFRPNTQHVSQPLQMTLVRIRDEFLGDQTEESVLRQFMTHKTLKQVIILVLTAINFVVPFSS